MSVGSDFHLSLHPSSSLLSLSVGMTPCPRGKHRGTRTRPGSTHRAAAAGAVSRVLGSLRPATAPAPTQAAGRVTKTADSASGVCLPRLCVPPVCHYEATSDTPRPGAGPHNWPRASKLPRPRSTQNSQKLLQVSGR